MKDREMHPDPRRGRKQHGHKKRFARSTILRVLQYLAQKEAHPLRTLQQAFLFPEPTGGPKGGKGGLLLIEVPL